MSPVPPGEVPIWVGGLSAPALRRAATLGDGWVSDLHTTDELRAFVGRLQELRRDSPRAARPFSVAAACRDAFDLDGYRRLEEVGVTLEAKCQGIARFGEDVIARMEGAGA